MYFCMFHFHIILQFTSEFYVTLQLLNAYIPQAHMATVTSILQATQILFSNLVFTQPTLC